MSNTEKIRNVSVIAHIDHGKSTLTDSFAARAGLISSEEAGTKRIGDGRADEKERGITIKSTGISMNIEFENQNYIINLIDSPGHADFNAEVSSALRITDGAIVVVDAVEGVAVQTETVLRQALAEQVRPILFVNKMDRHIFELQLSPSEVYDKLVSIIAEVNVLIETYQTEGSTMILSPELGNVFFGSARDGWGFGLHTFARLLAEKNKNSVENNMKKLWGDYFFDPENKKITAESARHGKMLERTFCRFVLAPIFNIVKAIMNKDDKYLAMLDAMGVKLTEKDLSKCTTEKDIYRMAMRKFIPVAEAILYGVTYKLPSPIEAQKYRCVTLYDGPMNDECAEGIKNCDPNGPLVVYISKMIPVENGGRFYAFGRVFSGTVSAGQKVRILGTNYKFGTKEDLYENKPIQRVAKMVGNKAETCEFVTCGNTVALCGIDSFILKSCTITTSQTAHPIKTMKFSVSPVVRVTVSPKNMSDLPKLVEGLKKLSKSDPCVQTTITDDGDHIVAGVGELHIEICLNDLKEFMSPSEIKVSEPVVPFRETIIATSNQICLAKSPNKHNRLYMSAEPLHEELVTMMGKGEIGIKDDVNARSKILVNDFGWDVNDSKKIWTIGPEGGEQNGDATNICVDVAKGVQYLHEIKDHVIGGFNMAGNLGPLCEEPLRGIRFNLHDVTLHADTIHRGAGQIIPTAKRVLYASILTASPRLEEPIYLVEIQVPDNYVGAIYSCLSQKRGRVISEEKSIGSLNIIKGYLPVRNSFGFNGYIREKTSGQAFPNMVFDHWEIINSDPLDPTSEAGQIVLDVRKRKGLKVQLPILSDYLDKL